MPLRSRRRLLEGLASLASAVPLFRAGTTLPAASPPLIAAPTNPPGEGRRVRGRVLRRSLELSAAEGVSAEVFTACAAGTVLTGWALHLGFGPVLVALLGALPFVSQWVQLPAAWLTGRFGARWVAVIAIGISRLIYLPLALLPLADPGPSAARVLLLTVAGLSGIAGVVGNNAWVSWMGELVPAGIRGRYFGRRVALCTVGGTLAALGAGVLLDLGRRYGVERDALSALSLVACAAGALSTWMLTRQAPPPPQPRPSMGWRDVLRPFRDPDARRYIEYQLLWNAAIGLSSAFFAIHMLGNLGMGFTLVAVHGAAVALVRTLMAPVWGRALDRFGARPVLIACSWAIATIPVVWLFARDGFLWPLALDAILSGVLWSGHALAAFELPLAITSRTSRPFYLAAFATAGGLAFSVASLAGGTLASVLPAQLAPGGWTNLHVLFVLSAAGRILAAMLALRIREPGSLHTRNLLDSGLRWLRERQPRTVVVKKVRSGPDRAG